MTETLIESPIRGLAVELRRQLETKRDLIADTRRVSFSFPTPELLRAPGGWPEGPLLVDLPDGAEAFGVTRHAHTQIAEHLNIPWKFYDRLLTGGVDHSRRPVKAQPDLLAGVVNGLLAREPSKQMLRTMDGKVRAFLTDRYRPRDNWDLLDTAILPVLADFPGRVEFKQCDLTEKRMYIKLVLPDMEKPVRTAKVHDVVRGGAIISNSEVGSGSLYIYPYTDVLICKNGAVHTEYGQRRIHVGKRATNGDGAEAWEWYSDETIKLDDEAFFAKTADTLRGVLNETVFDRIVADMEELAGIEIGGSPVEAVEVLAKKLTLTESEQGSMLNALINGGDTSAWGYVNGLTRMARDIEDADRQTELEILAGKLVADRDWAEALVAA